ncbi:MAG: hypothetical protein Q9O24_05545 [Gammaproteobacteria bacterium]|nr:hypothetical protein [Gammaproteobacteria bacterium]
MNRNVRSRRDFLASVLAAGAAALLPTMAQARVVKRVSGSVIINGGMADKYSSLMAGDKVITGEGGRLSFVLNESAFLLYPNSTLTFIADDLSIAGYRLEQGRLLVVCREAGQTFSVQGVYIGIEQKNSALQLSHTNGEVLVTLQRGKVSLKAGAQQETLQASQPQVRQFKAGKLSVANSAEIVADDLAYLSALLGF